MHEIQLLPVTTVSENHVSFLSFLHSNYVHTVPSAKKWTKKHNKSWTVKQFFDSRIPLQTRIQTAHTFSSEPLIMLWFCKW